MSYGLGYNDIQYRRVASTRHVHERFKNTLYDNFFASSCGTNAPICPLDHPYTAKVITLPALLGDI